MASPFAAADYPYSLAKKGTGLIGGIANWEYDDFSVGSTCSGLSDLVSLQSSENDSPRVDVFDGPPPQGRTPESITSALSPFAAVAWDLKDQPKSSRLECSGPSMDWTATGTTTSEEEPDASGSAKKTDATRTAKRARRREQQKAAQQRYRQRIRSWASDMEVKVDELAQQHEEVKAQHAKLVAQRTPLESRVKQLEEDLAAKRAQAVLLRERLGSGQESDMALAADPASVAAAAAGQLSDSIAALRAHIEEHNSNTMSKQGISEASKKPQDLQQLLAAYSAAAAAQGSAQAKTGAAEDTGRLQGDPVAMKRAESIVKALQLKPMQGQTLAWIRERQLKKVAALAKARRDLSMQAMSNMLPTLRLTATSLEERLGSLSMAGGLAVPPEAAELDVMVDAIKANIKEERDAIAELDDLVMHRALTPVQAAIFIIESFPGRPDGFALVDALAQMPGLQLPAARVRRANA